MVGKATINELKEQYDRLKYDDDQLKLGCNSLLDWINCWWGYGGWSELDPLIKEFEEKIKSILLSREEEIKKLAQEISNGGRN